MGDLGEIPFACHKWLVLRAVMRRLSLCALVATNYPCYSGDIKAPVPPTRSEPHLLHKPP